MNICMFCASFLPKRGGMEYVIHHLSNALVDQGHSVTVIAARVTWAGVKEHHKYRLIRYGFPVRGFGHLGINHVCAVMAYIFSHTRRPFDILHCHSASYAGSRARTIKSLFKNIPLVITPHGEDIQRVPEIEYGMRLDDRWDRIIMRNLSAADLVTAISLSVEKELDFLDSSRIKRIPNGVHVSEYSKNSSDYLRKRLNIENEKVIYLSVGRNHVKKGYALGISVISAIVHSENVKNIHYVIVGRGVSEHAKLVTQLELDNHVSLIEELPPEDVRQCYCSADVFFSPSIIEGLSLVSIEAIASGLPVIVTDVPGNIDIVNDTQAGLVAKSGDIYDMSVQILRMMDEAERCTYSSRARDSAQQYDWSEIAQQYIDAYHALT